MFCNEKKEKIRKEQHCIGCERIFPPGSLLLKRSGIWDSEFYNYYLCEICNEFMGFNHDWYQDGIVHGEIMSEGWGALWEFDGVIPSSDFLDNWLKTSKPLCVEYEGHWKRCKNPTGKGYFYEKLPTGF